MFSNMLHEAYHNPGPRLSWIISIPLVRMQRAF